MSKESEQADAANEAFVRNNPYANDYRVIQGALVSVMRQQLSWHQRCAVADAMLVVQRHYDSMIAEARDMAAAYAQQSRGNP